MLIDYLVKAKEAKRANGHSVQARITLFQDSNKQVEVLTGNIAILQETLIKIEQISSNFKLSPHKDVEGKQPNCPSLK